MSPFFYGQSDKTFVTLTADITWELHQMNNSTDDK